MHGTREPRNFARFIAFYAALALVFLGSAALLGFSVRQTDRDISERLSAQARFAALAIDEDDLETYVADQAHGETHAYRRLADQLETLVAAYPNFLRVWLFGRGGAEPAFLIAAGSGAERYSEDLLRESAVLRSHAEIITSPDPEFFRASVPVRDTQGTVAAHLVVDIENPGRWGQLASQACPIILFVVAVFVILIASRLLNVRRRRLGGSAPRWMNIVESFFIVCIGISVTVFGSWAADRNEQRTFRNAFIEIAEAQFGLVADFLAEIRDTELEAMARFYEGSEWVTQEEFERFSGFLARNRSVHAWMWIPAVPRERLGFFTSSIRAEGVRTFEVWERDPAGFRMNAGNRDLYFPVYRTTRADPGHEILGYDFGSDEIRLALLRTAQETGLVWASDPIEPLPGEPEYRSMLIVRPVYTDAESGILQGFAVAQLLGEQSNKDPRLNTPSLVLDISIAAPGAIPVASTAEPSPSAPGVPPTVSGPMFMLGKTFHVSASAGSAFLELYPRSAWWMTLITGTSITIAFALAFGILLHRRSFLEHMVAERTTDLFENERRLVENQRILEKSQEIAHVGSWTIDPESGTLTVSEEVTKILGLHPDTRETAFGTFIDTVHPDDRARVDETLRASIHESEDSFEFEHRIVRRNTGEIRHVRERYVHEYGDAGIVVRSVGMIQDITEQTLAEEKIIQALREKETLIRELYHRTKNNMQTINSMLSLHAVTADNPAVTEFAAELEQKILAMALVHQKLYQAQNLSRIDLGEYLGELSRLLLSGQTLAADSVRLETDLEEIPVMIDTAIPCGLMVNELVTNSFKHAFPHGRGGTIRIGLHRGADGRIELAFSDDGVGVEPGFDFHECRTLGLQTVAAIAEQQLEGEVVFTGTGGVSWVIRFRDELYGPRV